MKRYKTYDVPHKGLRNALSQLSLLSGKTDYTNPSEVKRLYDLGTDVFKILNIHANDENAVTLAELEIRLPGASHHDMEDHDKLHLLQDKLEKLLLKIHQDCVLGKNTELEGEEFYLAVSEFQGIYLAHIAEEERITQLLLWEHFTDEELSAHRGKIMSQNPPETLLTWFKFVLPAQNQPERVALFGGFKKMAPEPFFKQGLDVVEKALTPNEFLLLKKALQIK